MKLTDFEINELYLSGKGRKFKVIRLDIDRNMVVFESIEKVVNAGTEVNGHRMGLKLSQCVNFTKYRKINHEH